MAFVILPDVSCDLNADICREFGLRDYVRGHVIIDGSRDIPAALDWETLGMQEFYKLLTDKKHTVTTAPSNADEYYKYFEKYVLNQLLSLFQDQRDAGLCTEGEGAFVEQLSRR